VAISVTAAHNSEGQTTAHAFQLAHEQLRDTAPYKLQEMRQCLSAVDSIVFDERCNQVQSVESPRKLWYVYATLRC
jgi:hypothetical protein